MQTLRVAKGVGTNKMFQQQLDTGHSHLYLNFKMEVTSSPMLFFLLLMLLFRSVCQQVSNQADKLDLLAIFYY